MSLSNTKVYMHICMCNSMRATSQELDTYVTYARMSYTTSVHLTARGPERYQWPSFQHGMTTDSGFSPALAMTTKIGKHPATHRSLSIPSPFSIKVRFSRNLLMPFFCSIFATLSRFWNFPSTKTPDSRWTRSTLISFGVDETCLLVRACPLSA